MSDYAEIVGLDHIVAIRGSLGRIVCASGGFDPLHPGHVSYIIESKHYGDTLVVIVNGDSYLTRKKGKPFMELMTRCSIISGIRSVDYVIPFENGADDTVCEALRQIRPQSFTNGGDRADSPASPEQQLCISLGIKIIRSVGIAKMQSSSGFLNDWTRFRLGRSQ
jgi:D-beta-D-heptose 7-phosphate kinase/D-beta-D-heptose 1-phosphate adenosyltransferase